MDTIEQVDILHKPIKRPITMILSMFVMIFDVLPCVRGRRIDCKLVCTRTNI